MARIIDVQFGAFTPEEERQRVLRKLGLQPESAINEESEQSDSNASNLSFNGKLHSIIL